MQLTERRPKLAMARETLEAQNGADDPAAASVRANQARLLSEAGELEAAQRVFEAARETTLAATRLRGDESKLVMNHILHARVLQLYAGHCATAGKVAEAEELRAAVRDLELRFGFATQ